MLTYYEILKNSLNKINFRLEDKSEVVVSACDLEKITELGRGAYGVVEKMRHRTTGMIFAVKV